MHLRLARTQTACEMRVSFSAANFHTEASVRWGEVAGSYPHVTRAESSTYTADDLCGPPATTHGIWPIPFFYSAVVGSSDASCVEGSRIFYQVGGPTMGWSAERSFILPAPPNEEASLHITALADMGETYIDGLLPLSPIPCLFLPAVCCPTAPAVCPTTPAILLPLPVLAPPPSDYFCYYSA